MVKVEFLLWVYPFYYRKGFLLCSVLSFYNCGLSHLSYRGVCWFREILLDWHGSFEDPIHCKQTYPQCKRLLRLWIGSTKGNRLWKLRLGIMCSSHSLLLRLYVCSLSQSRQMFVWSSTNIVNVPLELLSSICRWNFQSRRDSVLDNKFVLERGVSWSPWSTYIN